MYVPIYIFIHLCTYVRVIIVSINTAISRGTYIAIEHTDALPLRQWCTQKKVGPLKRKTRTQRSTCQAVFIKLYTHRKM